MFMLKCSNNLWWFSYLRVQMGRKRYPGCITRRRSIFTFPRKNGVLYAYFRLIGIVDEWVKLVENKRRMYLQNSCHSRVNNSTGEKQVGKYCKSIYSKTTRS